MSNIIDPKRFSEIEEQFQKLSIERELAIQKALRSDNVDDIFKAQQYLNKIKPKSGQAAIGSQKSILMDPFEIASSMGYYQKSTQVSYEMLRAMGRVPIINAIIMTRKDQVADFCVPQPDKYSTGFVFKKRGQKDDQDLNDREKREVDQLTQFLINCAEDEAIFDLQDFDALIRMIVEDSLMLDQACFEIVQNNFGEPIKVVPVDATTIRLADSYDNKNNIKQGDVKINGYFPSYVQIYQNVIVNEYYPWELCFGTRNPSTAIMANGYGKSELEILISTVTSMLNTDAYNAKFFRNGTAPKGALMVKNQGGLNRDKISELRREWTAMMSGVDNMHKTPILDAEKVEWVDLYKSNREMEFSKFQEYLIKVACACYKISPEEIGFPLQGYEGNGLGSKEGGQQEKAYSLDKGLKPLLKSVQNWINKFIIYPKSGGKYEFQFAGIGAESSADEEKRLIEAGKAYMEINEVRAVRGLKSLPYGNVILDPTAFQAQQGHQMMQQGINPFTQPQKGDSQEENEDKNSPFKKDLDSWWEKEMAAA